LVDVLLELRKLESPCSPLDAVKFSKTLILVLMKGAAILYLKACPFSIREEFLGFVSKFPKLFV
jgi:hypothetical protein